ncbi:hypothetical protein KOW79_009035 [Hemibagrus wyckioides]|uniref:Uncharacterized protein n=1 Tax=Hemibagrus wyckioides TaxID=337641 RepID=A0A9D3NRZ1_9TELE|nr:hypothetical protein KOW79_009035 [Hemibagrus wyckioides]
MIKGQTTEYYGTSLSSNLSLATSTAITSIYATTTAITTTSPATTDITTKILQTMSAQAVVWMQSVTELSDEKIILYIEEFYQQIQAKVNGTIKMTVKKIEKVTA